MGNAQESMGTPGLGGASASGGSGSGRRASSASRPNSASSSSQRSMQHGNNALSQQQQQQQQQYNTEESKSTLQHGSRSKHSRAKSESVHQSKPKHGQRVRSRGGGHADDSDGFVPPALASPTTPEGVLMRSPFFLAFADAQDDTAIQDFAHHFDKIDFHEGDFVWRKNDQRVFVVAKGEVNATCRDEKKREIFLASHGPGDVFGPEQIKQLASSKGATGRAVRVVAYTDCTLLVLTPEAYIKYLIAIGPDVAAELRPKLDTVMAAGMLSTLRNLPFLRGLPEDTLSKLSCCFRYQTLHRGQVLFSEGDRGDTVYVIVKGGVRIKVNKDGAKRIARSRNSEERRKGPFADSSSSVAGTTTKQTASRSFRRRKSKKNKRGTIMGVSTATSKGSDSEGALSGDDDKRRRNRRNRRSLTSSLTVSDLKAGTYFGEVSLYCDVPRTATAVATANCLLLSLSKARWDTFLLLVPRDIRERCIEGVKFRAADLFRHFEVPFFAAIPEDRLQQMALQCDINHYHAHQTVFREGDRGRAFYVILHGAVNISVSQEREDKSGNPTGRREDVVVSKLTKGKYFGEIALLNDIPRSATATCVSSTVLLELSAEKFQKFCDESPEAFADFQLKLHRYKTPLSVLLGHPKGLELFTEHLKSEYADENIEFWKKCGELQALADEVRDDTDPKVQDMCKDIRKRFIGNDAPRQVNLEYKTVLAIEAAVDGNDGKVISPGVFDEARNSILGMMANDNYARFKMTEGWTVFLYSLDAYRDDVEKEIGDIIVEEKQAGEADREAKAISSAAQTGGAKEEAT